MYDGVPGVTVSVTRAWPGLTVASGFNCLGSPLHPNCIKFPLSETLVLVTCHTMSLSDLAKHFRGENLLSLTVGIFNELKYASNSQQCKILNH